MEQDVETGYRNVCSTCLSSDRNLISINNLSHVYQVFRLLMYDFAGENPYGENVPEGEQLICWECLALMRRFVKFKRQVHSAQEHLRVLAMSRGQEEIPDHTYMSQTLSTLEMVTRVDFDKIFFDYSTRDPIWSDEYTLVSPSDEGSIKDEQGYDMDQIVGNNISLENSIDITDHILEVPEIVLENPITGMMSHIVMSTEASGTFLPSVSTGTVLSQSVETSVPVQPTLQVSVCPMTDTVIVRPKKEPKEEKLPHGFLTEHMTEEAMLAYREKLKQKVQYASSVYKCELCVIGFYSQKQVEDHFEAFHRAKQNQIPCRVCFVYTDPDKLEMHISSHYYRYICTACSHVEHSLNLMNVHVASHSLNKQQPGQVNIGIGKKKKEKRKLLDPILTSQKREPSAKNLRKLLSKTVIEGYQCLECDMFFKSSRSRASHVARTHREGFQCDHCKKRFVNRTTLTTHLRLHEGPLPREECPICHKLVRVVQLKYHIKRHESKSKYECKPCQKIFSHLATYQAHLKYSRAHASDEIFKFPCPMCNKGYATKEQMQDHFNYQHLGKTSHKCPICNKPIASRANVEKHVMRVHGQKREKPRSHVCQFCGKGFTDKKSLNQHLAIHSSDRPLSCDICQMTFKQKASLYTHRKRVHKVVPPKKEVEFMGTKVEKV